MVRIGLQMWEIWQKISPILFLVVLVLQFESLYLKNCERYRSEI